MKPILPRRFVGFVAVLIAVTALVHVQTVAAGDLEEEGRDRLTQEPGMLITLDLTEPQLAQLKADRIGRHKKLVQERAQLEMLHMELWEAANAAQPSQAKVEQIAKKIGELQGTMTYERAQSVVFLRSVLTPAQIKKFDTMQLQFGGPAFGGPSFRGKKRPARQPR